MIYIVLFRVLISFCPLMYMYPVVLPVLMHFLKDLLLLRESIGKEERPSKLGNRTSGYS
jgi:hypothetical protein